MLELVQKLGDKALVMPLGRFLLKPNDAYLVRELGRLAGVREEGLENTDMTWRPSLLAMCRKKGFEIDDLTLPSGLATAPGILSLCRRQRTARDLYHIVSGRALWIISFITHDIRFR
jgi:hypothetical protein